MTFQIYLIFNLKEREGTVRKNIFIVNDIDILMLIGLYLI